MSFANHGAYQVVATLLAVLTHTCCSLSVLASATLEMCTKPGLTAGSEGTSSARPKPSSTLFTTMSCVDTIIRLTLFFLFLSVPESLTTLQKVITTHYKHDTFHVHPRITLDLGRQVETVGQSAIGSCELLQAPLSK